MPLTAPEEAACRKLIEMALAEDLGEAGDITSKAVIPADLPGEAAFVARADGVVAGLSAAALVCSMVDVNLAYNPELEDGARVKPGDFLATVDGPMRSILAAERTALNFLQHLSGVATLTSKFVDAIAGLATQILDTRKTTPGWRLLEKHAVRCGGGCNLRMGLYDGVLIKDNHLAAVAHNVLLTDVVKKAQDFAKQKVPVEVEVEALSQLERVLPLRPTIVMLDNMSAEQMRAAVAMRNKMAPGVLLEASGGVTLLTVRAIAETGVERISVGALTHSAPALDIALDYLS
ncbi:MAG TPA: carboxylating nicotinate-nucleotide diphosphorylase [Gemmataceae bacterium]|nr:carboxylating nicotinate-nucleotide diphosphorylase [Gemmataceae bacterium]